MTDLRSREKKIMAVCGAIVLAAVIQFVIVSPSIDRRAELEAPYISLSMIILNDVLPLAVQRDLQRQLSTLVHALIAFHVSLHISLRIFFHRTAPEERGDDKKDQSAHLELPGVVIHHCSGPALMWIKTLINAA